MLVSANIPHPQRSSRVPLGKRGANVGCVLKCPSDKSRPGGCAALPSLRSTGPGAPPVPPAVAPRRTVGTVHAPYPTHRMVKTGNAVLRARYTYSPGRGQTRVNQCVAHRSGFDMVGASITSENSLALVITPNICRLKRMIETVYTS